MPAETSVNSSSTDKKRIAVLGASGYTGEEVVRLLAQHPNFKVTALTGESQAGKVWTSLFPSITSLALLSVPSS